MVSNLFDAIGEKLGVIDDLKRCFPQLIYLCRFMLVQVSVYVDLCGYNRFLYESKIYHS